VSITYNEILDEMKTAFFNESGKNVNNLSDLEMRFKAVASEIYSVAAYGDYIFRQGFPQTASGEYLDRHAALRGIKRKNAAAAAGTLTFSLENAAEKDISIPKGTVCSVKDRPYIQFATVSEAVIKAGELQATADAQALASGEAYNAGAGEITVMVNPPEYVAQVRNNIAFTGGNDAESDESLRERIISSYSTKYSAIGMSSVRNEILSLDGVSDACVSPGENGTVNVCLKTKSGTITDGDKEEIKNILGLAVLCGLEINCFAADAKTFSVAAEVKMLSGYDAAAIKKETEERIKEFCSGEKIGVDFSESAIASAAYGTAGLDYIEIFASPARSGSVCCKTNEYLKLSAVTVNVHE